MSSGLWGRHRSALDDLIARSVATGGDRGGGVEDEADRASPRSVPEAEVFRFDHVDQLGGRTHGPDDRKGLALRFDRRGVEVIGSDPGAADLLVPWPEVTWSSIGEPETGADGGTTTTVELESGAGLVRYVVRSDGPIAVQMAGLAARTSRWAGHGPPSTDRAESEAAAETGTEATADTEAATGTTAAAETGSSHAETAADTEPAADTEATADTEPAATEATVETEVEGGTAAAEGVGTDLLGPPPLGPPPFGPPKYGLPPPYGPPGSEPPRAYPAGPVGKGPPGKRRTRRTATLVVALILLASGIGLAVGLSTTASNTASTAPSTATGPSADAHLARLVMLTKSDLPQGWEVAKGNGDTATSPAVQRGETQITKALARCMVITASQAAIVLGGQATDQTAQTASPIFVAPSSAAAAGSALELQTAATVVHSHHDELSDFSLFGNPRYAPCAATAAASELQLGVDQTSGGHDQPGPASVSPVNFPGPVGLQEAGLIVAFSVKDGSASLPVQVESISLGANRVEASLQVFAIGGQIPNDALAPAFSTFEQRVASGGKSSVV